jgi:proteasome accessory factor C
MPTASDQLARLLSLLPWLRAHPGVTKDEAAAAFGISVDQLERDLRLAFTCELPGRPDVFIDIDYLDSDRVSVIDPAGIERPLRLRADEAVALLVGLRALAAVPGLQERGPLDSALAKLEDAAAQAGLSVATPAAPVPGQPAERSAAAAAAVRAALADHRQLRLSYWVPSRDEVTERVVDPARLVTVDDSAYLEGYCHSSEAVRTFRLDRVVAAEVLGEAAGSAPPSRGEPTTYHPSPGDTVVVLDLRPEARWVPEYYPCESVVPLADGGVRATLRTADPRLAVRLALRLGGALRVVEPPEVAATVAAAARSALEAYGVSTRRDSG